MFRRGLNVVAGLYRWSLAAFAARRTAMSPVEVEAAMSVTKRGRRKRRWVLEAMAWKILEITGAALVLALALLGASRLVDDRTPTVASLLDLAGTAFACFPLGLVLGILAWSIRPERREGGWFDHPERLWVPSMFTFGFTIVLALLAW